LLLEAEGVAARVALVACPVLGAKVREAIDAKEGRAEPQVGGEAVGEGGAEVGAGDLCVELEVLSVLGGGVLGLDGGLGVGAEGDAFLAGDKDAEGEGELGGEAAGEDEGARDGEELGVL
jgi:hypothetical protein